MIVHFEWGARFDYDTKLVCFKVVRLVYPKMRWGKPERKRHYRLQARDMSGVEWFICTLATDGPLTDAERKHVIDMAPYHPTMGVHYGKRD